MPKKIWSEKIVQLRNQLLVQQEWLPNITCFKLFENATFGDFLNQCTESSKAVAITQAVNEAIVDHPGLDLTGHESYDPDFISQAGDDLMTTVLNAPSFPFLDFFNSSGRVKTFEEILASTIDEDVNYQRIKSEDPTSTLNPLEMGLFLVGEPIGI